MEAAVTAGAAMINDISALLFDDRSLEVAKTLNVPVVLMHAPSHGTDPHKGGDYDDVVTNVFDWLKSAWRPSKLRAYRVTRSWSIPASALANR